MQSLLRLAGGGRSRLCEQLLVFALVEARSHERLALLGEAVAEPRLKDFYQRLAQAEAGHAQLFVDLARVHGGGIDVDRRLAEMADEEAALVAGLPLLPRIH